MFCFFGETSYPLLRTAWIKVYFGGQALWVASWDPYAAR